MNVTPQQVAVALLNIAKGVSTVAPDGQTIAPLGGRSGEGGEIKLSPFVEIADAPWSFEGVAAGYGLVRATARFGVLFWLKYSQDVEYDKAVLRGLFASLFDAIKADPTLGGLVDDARVIEADNSLDTAADFWLWVTLVEVTFET